MGAVKDFIKRNYRHFNAAVIVDASEAWIKHLDKGGKMFLTLGGAMSTAEMGVTIAELIRQDKVHAICCTGANLEEDVYNLVAHKSYVRVPHYRLLSLEDEKALYEKHLNRVTDTCIPEEEALRKIEHHMVELWNKAGRESKRYFPYEYFYQLLRSGVLKKDYEIDPKDSWLLAACEKDLPIWTPGWEDSTLGNMFVGNTIKKTAPGFHVMKAGVEQMEKLVGWYRETSAKHSIGFFQVAGGIAGDFPICVVPLMHQDMKEEVPYWGYFCQISDSTTSYGSYSGATPNEKITWGKVAVNTPMFVIESDATIVFPLVAYYVLNQ